MRTHPGLLAIGLVLMSWLGGAGADGLTRGLLFEVSGCYAAPSYLFGTIHSDDPRVIRLPAVVQAQFDKAQGFVMEAIPDPDSVRKATALMHYADGRTLKQVLPAPLYGQAISALASRGLSEGDVKTLKPWALVTLLSSPPTANGEFLDMRLYGAALAQGKPVVGLETMDEQIALFDRLSETEQVALLNQTLATYHELRSVFQRLVAAYLLRDLSALVQLNDMYRRWGSEELAERFEQAVINERNAHMAERMQPLLAQGGQFIAVGALHLPGPKGLLQRLTDQGCKVRTVY
jgi:uncharacterized protein